MIFQKKEQKKRTKRQELLIEIIRDSESREKIEKYIDKEYLYWDKIKHKEDLPTSIEKEEAWEMIKILRIMKGRKIVVRDTEKKSFFWNKLIAFEEFFHKTDMDMGGRLMIAKGDLDRIEKQKLLSRGIIEEAIASSQLEGAVSSRREAREMIRTNRKPKSESEQMILNSYLGMQNIEKIKEQSMNMKLLKEIHNTITEETTDDQGEAPRMRKVGEKVYVKDSKGVIIYTAPEKKFVSTELKRLFAFANDELGEKEFLHPIVKAIILHFWIGYLHPFTDGNGRLARQLFYWYLLKKGYWAFQYLPISTMIKKSPEQYKKAYLHTEEDDNDITYFIDYNIKKIKQAIKSFEEYQAEQYSKNKKMKKAAGQKFRLNSRQVQLLQYLNNSEDERTTTTMHTRIYQVTKVTASRDLKDLEKKGLLETEKVGRYLYYYGTIEARKLFDK